MNGMESQSRFHDYGGLSSSQATIKDQVEHKIGVAKTAIGIEEKKGKEPESARLLVNTVFFLITVEIHPRSLAKFYCQYADM